MTEVAREEIAVMFLRTKDEIAEIQRGWTRLEELVPPQGRKFYGTFDPVTNEYRACVAVKEGDDPSSLGLELGTIPGGRYMRARLRDEPPRLYSGIGPTFQAMLKHVDVDKTRPQIEFYRARNEIDLLLPV